MKPLKIMDTENHCYPSAPDRFDEVRFTLYPDGEVIVKSDEGDSIINVDILKSTVDALHKAFHLHRAELKYIHDISDIEC